MVTGRAKSSLSPDASCRCLMRIVDPSAYQDIIGGCGSALNNRKMSRPDRAVELIDCRQPGF